MTTTTTRILSAATAVVLSFSISAQSTVDIGLFQNSEGMLEVKVRPQSDFNGIFSSLVFALRYDKNSDVQLGVATQPVATASYMSVARSGAVHENGDLAYQVYAGFGFQNMQEIGAHWEAGKEYTVLTVPVSGKAVVELVNDAWTNEVKNNADFYVSLGGQDLTGTIYRSLANADGLENTVTIQPNPNQGEFQFSFISVEPADIRIEMLNTLGQSVYNEQLRNFEGMFRKEMDLKAQSHGIYYLKLTRGGDVSVHKVVYR